MSYHAEGCEPCGECAWCAQRFKWKEEAIASRLKIKRLARALATLAAHIEDEGLAAGPDEVKQHPGLRRHARDAAAARRLISRLSKGA